MVRLSRDLLNRVLNVLEAVDGDLAGDVLAAANRDDEADRPTPRKEAGPRFEDRYVLIEDSQGAVGVLGSGGTAQVLLARDQLLGRTVAVKRPRANLPRHQLDLLVTEALRAAGLFHPGLLPVFDLLYDRTGQACIILPIVPRGTWDRRLSEVASRAALLTRAHAGLRQGLADIAVVARTLQHLHASGLVHGDVKPENIGVGEHGEIFLLDLGASTSRDDQSVSTAQYGTPAWLPDHTHPAWPSSSPRRDIWATGWLLRCICTAARSPREIRAFPKPLRELEALWARATDSDPASQPTLSGLVAGIEDWLADRPVADYHYTVRDRLERLATKRGPEMVTGLLLVVLLGMTFVAWANWREAHDSRLDLWRQEAKQWLYVDPDRARLAAAMSLKEGESPQTRGLFIAASTQGLIDLVASRSVKAGCADLAWSPDASLVACANPAKEGIQLLSGTDLSLTQSLLPAQGALSVAWRSSQELVVGTSDGEVLLLNLASGLDERIDHHVRGTLPEPVNRIRLLRGGDVISTGNTGEVHLVAPDETSPTVIYRGHDSIRSLEISTDRLFIVDKGLRQIEIADPTRGAVLIEGTEKGDSLASAPDADALVLSSINATDPVYVFRSSATIPDARIVGAISNIWGGVWAAAFVPGSAGKRVVLGGANGAIAIWNSESRRVEAEVRGASKMQGCLAVSPSGQLLASADGEGSVKLWDIRRAIRLPGLRSIVMALRTTSGTEVEAVSDVGRRLAISDTGINVLSSGDQNPTRATGWLRSGRRVEANYSGEIWVESDDGMRLIGRNSSERWHVVDCDNEGCVGGSLSGGVFAVTSDGLLKWSIGAEAIRKMLGGTPVAVATVVAAGREVLVAPNTDFAIRLSRRDGAVIRLEQLPKPFEMCSSGVVLPGGIEACVVGGALYALGPVRLITNLEGLNDVLVERMVVDHVHGYLIAGDMHGGIHVYSLADWSRVATWSDPSGWITAMILTSSGHLWTGTLNGAVTAWDLSLIERDPSDLLVQVDNLRWRVQNDQIVPVPGK